MYIQRKRVVADEELDLDTTVDVEEEPMDEGETDVVVEPEATDLLFEAEDVAELVAEITGQPVEVSVDEDAVTFAVGEDEFKVEPEGDEEILESVRRPLKSKKPIAASTKRADKKPQPKRIPRTTKKQ